MTSQHSHALRRHPGYESARDRQRRQAREDIARFLNEAARLRARLGRSRILLAPESPSALAHA